MRYTDHIKTIRNQYFERFAELKRLNPRCSDKDIYEKLENEYDYSMYSTYDSFRTSIYQYRKSLKQNKYQS
ncbi:MAG: hypothetical protein WAU01_14710 [Saprospiraceae bacterium]